MSSYPIQSSIPYVYYENDVIRTFVRMKANPRKAIVYIDDAMHVESVYSTIVNNSQFQFFVYCSEDIDVKILQHLNINVRRESFDSPVCVNDMQDCSVLVCSYNSRLLSHIIYHKIPIIVMGIPYKFMHPIIHEWYEDVDINDIINMNSSDYTNKEYEEYILWVQNASLILKRLLLN